MAEPRPVETLSRDHFDAQVSRGALTVFRYTPNSRGFIFLQVCAALLFIIAYVVYLATGFTPTYWIVASGLLCLLAFVLLGMVVYWTTYARRCAVAFDDAALYVISMRSVERILWRYVSVENAGFGESRSDGDHGTLRMHIEERVVAVRLFNPFVWIEDFPTFLVELLSQIKRNEQTKESGDEGVV